jgi:hypothetical protein
MKKLLIAFITGATIMFAASVFAVTTTFTDVSTNDWFYDDVMNMTEWDVIRGYPDGTFGPANNVNRAEISAMFNRYNNKINFDYTYPIDLLLEDFYRYKISNILSNKKLKKDLYDEGIILEIPNCTGFDGLKIEFELIIDSLERTSKETSYYNTRSMFIDEIASAHDECISYISN